MTDIPPSGKLARVLHRDYRIDEYATVAGAIATRAPGESLEFSAVSAIVFGHRVITVRRDGAGPGILVDPHRL